MRMGEIVGIEAIELSLGRRSSSRVEEALGGFRIGQDVRDDIGHDPGAVSAREILEGAQLISDRSRQSHIDPFVTQPRASYPRGFGVCWHASLLRFWAKQIIDPSHQGDPGKQEDFIQRKGKTTRRSDLPDIVTGDRDCQ